MSKKVSRGSALRLMAKGGKTPHRKVRKSMLRHLRKRHGLIGR